MWARAVDSLTDDLTHVNFNMAEAWDAPEIICINLA